MNTSDYLFTSESVAEGHPDKVCDRISDTIVDAFLAADPAARVAAETLATTNRIVIAGEVRGADEITHERNRAAGARRGARHRLRAARLPLGARPRSRSCCTPSRPTSRRASMRVGNKDEGAGDQGHHVRLRLPRDAGADAGADPARPHRSCARWRRRAGPARRRSSAPTPRARSPCAIVDGKPVCATSVVVSTQHAPELSQDEVRELVRPFVLADPARGLDVPGGRVLRQSDRQVRDRRARRRCRPDRAQDHRRHLWRRGAAWRRRVLRQGSRPRSTARPPMPPAISPRTWSRPASPSAA